MAHVVSVVLGASGPLLLKLADLIAGKYGRLKGVRKQILALKLELSSMHAAVKKYAMLEDPDVQVKEWMSIVRELAYDIEDCIDKFIHRLGKDGRHGGFKESFHRIAQQLKMLGARHAFADQIEDLKARIKQAKELKNSYKLDDSTIASSHKVVDPRLSALFAEEADLVGVDGPRDELAKWMMEERNSSKCCKVLSIVGFGGLGKTTLANEVYRKIQGEFHCRAFVSVSQKPDIKNIVKDVISQVSKQEGSTTDTSDWDEKRSITKLRELLQDKRYLIIIDDIWSTSAWEAIKCAFPKSNNSSRIIVTTRIIDVARSCCPSGDDRMYKMEGLSYVQSKSLFFKRIFCSEDRCPNMLEEVSDKILKKCGGLPLAIISISGLLANRPAVTNEWERVKRSIGSALENNRSMEGMRTILSLSYNDLSANLKTCLLYLSVFPEDYVIKRKRLVQRWIAEGFISEERGKSQYEVAESYFYELINKSMVQPVGISYDGKVRGCRVHDMMLEVIISKAGEENFITVVGGGQTGLPNRQGIIRRLAVQYIDHELAFALENEDLSHVRSLTVTSSDCIKYLPSLSKFEALRVLDFYGCQGLEQYDMSSVEKLFQLRYLCLKNTGISKLPSGIVMLSNLETLDFRNTTVQDLPTGFFRLTELQHLLTGMDTRIPSGIGIMSKLRVISHLNVPMSPANTLVELGSITSLNELYICLECRKSECRGPDEHKTHEEKLSSSLYKLIGSFKLRSLQICCGDNHSFQFLESLSSMPSALQMLGMCTNHYFRNIPMWIAPALTSLASLDINLTELTEDDLHRLGELPALLSLILTLERGEDRITVQGNGFLSLKHFEITSFQGTYSTFVKGAMPNLDYLKLKLHVSVGRKFEFYLGIVHLPCLRDVFVRVHSQRVMDSETRAAVAAIKEEVDAHINHPKVDISYSFYKTNYDKKESKDDNDTEVN